MLSSTSHYKQLFFTANGGLFERPTAAFFTMPAVVTMQRMALVMMTRRKIRFPTGVATVTKKAKPTTAAMAFCVYIILYYVLLQVTPAANRNTPNGLMTVWDNAAKHFFDDYARNIR